MGGSVFFKARERRFVLCYPSKGHGRIAAAKAREQLNEAVLGCCPVLVRHFDLTTHSQMIKSTGSQNGMILDGPHRKDNLQDSGSPHGMTIIPLEGIDGDIGQSSTIYRNTLHLIIV